MYAKGGGGISMVSFWLTLACYAVPARITQGVWMEFQKRLYFTQEDIILNRRRKEASEAAKKVTPQRKQEILQKWEELKKQLPTSTRNSEDNAGKST